MKGEPGTVQPPRVFISYSHDSEAHKDRVLQLADRLRRDGIDAVIDRYEPAPPDGWPHWMQEQIECADFVIMVCTEVYHRRVAKRELPCKGLGGTWEGHLIYAEFYRAGASSRKFLPVVLQEDDQRFIPAPFATLNRYSLACDAGYEHLLRSLTDTPDVLRRSLPTRSEQWSGRPEIRMLGVPSSPALFLGREEDMRRFKQVLGVLPVDDGEAAATRVAAVNGWPGVGKSTFVAALPHDPDVQATYPDGILWAAMGQSQHLKAQLQGTLMDWAADWGGPSAPDPSTLDRAIDSWAARLRRRRVLVIVDDVWRPDLVQRLLSIVDAGSSFVLTSRMPATVEQVVPRKLHRHRLDALNVDAAREVLRAFAPDVVDDHPEATLQLVMAVGCLPLALTVAGRLLGGSAAAVHGIESLLEDLRDQRLLQEVPPADMAALSGETLPSVAALLHKSTCVLDDEARQYFAQLGVFEPDPATFDLETMAVVWDVPDARPVAETLVGHGLLEALTGGRFRMHALVSTLARSMLANL